MISGKLITRNYNQFRGLDLSNRQDEVNIYRSPDALNIWKNYKKSSGKCIETRPDVELLKEYSNTIFGLFFYNNRKIVHSGTRLFDEDIEIFSTMAEHESKFFIYGNLLYIKDGTHYLVYNGRYCQEVEGYIPTTTISRTPSGGGTKYEDVNLISYYRKNSFSADGISTEYYLDTKELDSEPPRVWINGLETLNFSYDKTNGKVTFTTAPSEPDTVGQDNVVIQFKKTVDGYKEKIYNCTLLEMFDNRVFFSGNKDYPNFIWHSSLEDPTYCSDLDYYTEGVDDAEVKAIVAGNNALWVMKSPSQSNTTIFYHNPTIDAEYGKIYPSSHSSISTGCKTTGINFNDTICFYSENGLEAISSDVTTEQVITHKSSLIDSKILNEEYYESMRLEEWEGYLLTIIGNKIYLADSRQYSQINDHYEYEWYYFEMNDKITNSYVRNGTLYLCSEGKIYTLTNYGDREVESYWTTIEDEFNYPQYQKTTNKKGCVIDLEGKEILISTKIDNKKFEKVDTYKNVKGYVVPRIKKKKWKSIQIKFSSKYPFSLYSSTLESYIGSYVKR